MLLLSKQIEKDEDDDCLDVDTGVFINGYEGSFGGDSGRFEVKGVDFAFASGGMENLVAFYFVARLGDDCE